ncbi:hypothetical protein PG994_008666 [Apiospora phragmitis]|uniref:Uncharacterized protein n=1 Tax=Apiospora phragmitis TaxID=2905665 RepID=A0ABR1UK03_9PEZI
MEQAAPRGQPDRLFRSRLVSSGRLGQAPLRRLLGRELLLGPRESGIAFPSGCQGPLSENARRSLLRWPFGVLAGDGPATTQRQGEVADGAGRPCQRTSSATECVRPRAVPDLDLLINGWYKHLEVVLSALGVPRTLQELLPPAVDTEFEDQFNSAFQEKLIFSSSSGKKRARDPEYYEKKKEEIRKKRGFRIGTGVGGDKQIKKEMNKLDFLTLKAPIRFQTLEDQLQEDQPQEDQDASETKLATANTAAAPPTLPLMHAGRPRKEHNLSGLLEGPPEFIETIREEVEAKSRLETEYRSRLQAKRRGGKRGSGVVI